MGELTNKATNLEMEQLTAATVAMNLLVNQQGPVRTMDSGQEVPPLVLELSVQTYLTHPMEE